MSLTTGIHELKEMNKDKVGEPFHYPNTFLLLTWAMPRHIFIYHIRQTEGIAQGHAKGKVPSIPGFYNNKQKNKSD